MQEFAPTKSRLIGNCPSDEELAAYIDGALDKEETDRIEGHLVSCERCFEIYSETVQLQLEDKPAGEVVPFRISRKRWQTVVRYGLPIAAMLLVGIGAGSFFLAAPPALSPREVTASLPGDSGLIVKFWLGPTQRGGGEREEQPFAEASFQLGVQLVNLQVCLEANDTERAKGYILPRIQQVLKAQDTMSPLEDSFKAISADLEHRPPRELLGPVRQVALESRDYFDGSYLDMGQWVEGAHLAALTHDSSFFRNSGNRSFLRRLRWRDRFHDLLRIEDAKLDSATRGNLDRIAEIASRSDLQPASYEELTRQSEEILKRYYPQT
jgi:hypothetical protein